MVKHWEPHEWNKHLMDEQRKRGEEVNIPQINLPAHVYRVATEPVRTVDPREALKASRAAAMDNKVTPGGDAAVEPLRP